MRIAQVSPLYESVPPRYYGGTERVVSYLTEELQRQGHEVTLFASGDSVTSARLVNGSPRSLRLDESCTDPIAHHVVMLQKVMRLAPEYDMVHFHLDYLHFPLAQCLGLAHLTTTHGRLDLPDQAPLYKAFRDLPFVSISNSQRSPLARANWQATVYHGLPDDLYEFRSQPGRYLAFLGRISPEKGVDVAIEIARRVGIPLRIAAKVDRTNRDYFDAVIKPLFKASTVEFVGEIGDQEKNAFLGGAYALLFPIDWPEPFGLVMIEAMACGTPIIAFRRGAVPEIIEEGRSGFIVDGLDQAVDAAQRLPDLKRANCRAAFERRFTASRMASDYLQVYDRLATRQMQQAWHARDTMER